MIRLTAEHGGALTPLSELLGVARRVVHECLLADVVATVVTATCILLQEVSRNCVPVRPNFDYSPHQVEEKLERDYYS